MAGKGKASKTKIKDKKKSSSQTSGTTIKDEMIENQETEPRFGFIHGRVLSSPGISGPEWSSICDIKSIKV